MCLAITAFSHLENKPEEPRLLERGNLQGFCAIGVISEGMENYVTGLSAKVCCVTISAAEIVTDL